MSGRTRAASPTGTRMATGVYTGDGAATQSITGVGFQPRFVIVYRRAWNRDDYALKTDQDGLLAKFFTEDPVRGWQYETDAIISLDADGFTVGDGTGGSGNKFNVAAQTYDYKAFTG